MLCERHRTRQKDVSSCSFWIFYHNNALPDKKWEKLEDKKNAKEFFSGLFVREFKEDLPVELQTSEKEDTNS